MAYGFDDREKIDVIPKTLYKLMDPLTGKFWSGSSARPAFGTGGHKWTSKQTAIRRLAEYVYHREYQKTVALPTFSLEEPEHAEPVSTTLPNGIKKVKKRKGPRKLPQWALSGPFPEELVLVEYAVEAVYKSQTSVTKDIFRKIGAVGAFDPPRSVTDGATDMALRGIPFTHILTFAASDRYNLVELLSLFPDAVKIVHAWWDNDRYGETQHRHVAVKSAAEAVYLKMAMQEYLVAIYNYENGTVHKNGR